MSLYEDIRDGLKNALLLNEKVERLEDGISGLAQDVKTLAEHVHGIDKRVVRIETMVEVSVASRKQLSSET